MNGIDVQAAKEHYKDAPALYYLHDGGEIIGHEADADNRLVYVIRRDGDITLSYASDENPVMQLPITTPHTVTVTVGVKSKGTPRAS